MSEIPAEYLTTKPKELTYRGMEDSIEQFKAAMLAEGITPPNIIIADGQLKRFSTNGKKSDTAGWYMLHNNKIPVGSFGDFRLGISISWQGNIGRPLTNIEEKKYRSEINEIRRIRKSEEIERRSEAQKQAYKIWNTAQPCTKHPYLERKGIKAHGTRIYKESLLIPVMLGDELHSLQFVYADGKKRFLPNGRIVGCYCMIGNPKSLESKALCIAEGFATGATIFEATNYPVIIAFNAGNLAPVAKTIRTLFPELPIVLCADDDAGTPGNPGLTKATKAALSIGGLLAIPNFKDKRSPKATDFNDMAQVRNLESVRRVIMEVVTSAPVEIVPTKAIDMDIAMADADEIQVPLPPDKILATSNTVADKKQFSSNLHTNVSLDVIPDVLPKITSKTAYSNLNPVPKFSPTLLPEPLRRWVLDISKRQSVAADYAAVTALVAISTVIGRKVRIYPKRYDDWLVVPNLWAMLIGRPSAGKTPAMREALKPLRKLTDAALQQFKLDTDKYKATLKLQELKVKSAEKNARKALEDGDELLAMRFLTEATLQPAPTQPRYIVNDATVEKLGELLKQNPNGLLLERDELYGWLRTLDREDRSNDRTFFLEASNGDGTYTYDRIGRGTIHIPALCLSIVGGIQPSRLQPYISQAVRSGYGDDGFIQRFQLAVFPDPPVLQRTDDPPDVEAQDKVHKIFATLAALKPPQGDHIALRFSDDAQEQFYQWFDSNESIIHNQSLNPMMESHLIKFRSLIPSLALIIELVQDPGAESISLKAINTACAWGKYLRLHADRIYSLGNLA